MKTGHLISPWFDGTQNMQTRESTNRESRPGLSPLCSLYFDKQHQRWVIRAPNQVVFPDSESLEVLLLCDGTRTVEQISEKLQQHKHFDLNHPVTTGPVEDIITRFIRRGVLEMPPFK